MELFVEILRTFGLPTALSAVLVWYHIRTVTAKDQEIARLNDARVQAAERTTDAIVEMVQEQTAALADVTAATDKLSERIMQWQQIQIARTSHPG